MVPVGCVIAEGNVVRLECFDTPATIAINEIVLYQGRRRLGNLVALCMQKVVHEDAVTI